MKKILSVLALTLAVSGFLAAQTIAPVTIGNCTIEYDSAKKLVRLTNKNAEPFTVQYTIDGKGKTVIMDKNAVWEMDVSKAQPKTLDILKAQKAPKAGDVDKDWKLAAAGGSAPAATATPAAKPAPAPAPAAGGTPVKPAPAPKK
ncbi:MAG: hypothetical protein LBG87_07565 [Spirochaetaceae bacterium]|jgi:hypothetical protein|nr:hypothetical protein [Spirochaetaceae bacterium]